jgi:hypothetical protein
MHLLNYLVQNGQWVKAGQIIGHVGDTGIKIDVPHLHFQMRDNGEIIDPLVHLRPYLIGPKETYRGQLVSASMPGRWREARSRLRALAAGRRARGQDTDETNSDEVRERPAVPEAPASKDTHAAD